MCSTDQALRGIGNTHLNNFDLVRICAALQVALCHAVFILRIPTETSQTTHFLWRFLQIFPGVPAFFCISGFLIAASLERNQHRLSYFFEARLLRIYPALVCVTSLGTAMLAALGFFQDVPVWKTIIWFLSTALLGSTIHPEFLRGFGIGTWNGSLWTISVELSFYAFLPLLYGVCRRRRAMDSVLTLCLFSSFALFIKFDGLHFGETEGISTLSKVVWFSLPGNLWVFLIGVSAHRHFSLIRPLLEGQFLKWSFALVCVGFASPTGWSPELQVIWLFIHRLVLSAAALSAAYSYMSLSSKLLRGYDISYGFYLYHAPIFNLFRHLNRDGSLRFGAEALALTALVSVLSWLLIERPALRRKGLLLRSWQGFTSVPNPDGETSLTRRAP